VLYISVSDCSGEIYVDDFAFDNGLGKGVGWLIRWLNDPEDFVF